MSWIYPPPRMQSWQMSRFRLRFPTISNVILVVIDILGGGGYCRSYVPGSSKLPLFSYGRDKLTNLIVGFYIPI